MNTFFDIISAIKASTGSIANISITDIIDILIVAYALYRVILWGKETRTWSLFKGIALLAIASLLASIFKFHALEWIIRYIFNIGIIAVVILFQPELRKALERLGQGRLISSITGTEKVVQNSSDFVVDEISKACQEMSKSKTGALIVIEEEISLIEYIKTGILIDGLVSSQLIINIFQNKTPLHDGAVIISKNRVAAASCILPLTQSKIGQNYGTRHRAAVGTSEISDAKVLVVSEETGNISLMIGGNIYKNLERTILKEKLLSNKDILNRRVIFRKVNKIAKKNKKNSH